MTPEEELDLVRAIIAGGESYYAEFKSAWHYGADGKAPRRPGEIADDIARTVVAFANAEGGDLLVGVEDDGAVTGLAPDEGVHRFLVNVPGERVEGDPGVRVRTIAIDGERVLWFRVEEARDEPVITSDGRCLAREGAATRPILPREIERRRQHRRGDRSYEATPVPGASIGDLDLDAIDTAARSAGSGGHLAHLDPEELLQYWNLAEARNGTLVLKRAALLLFARRALRWHPNNRLRLRRVHGSEEGYGRGLRTRERDIEGPILHILRRASQAVHGALTVEAQDEELFMERQLLPREAIREVLVNAVAHRNYAIEGQAIEVLLFPDRMEVRSPGRLPEPITVQDLVRQRGVHRSRNPLVMRVLRDLGWSRDQGEGMRRIFGSMRQVELHQPELEEVADTFVVRLSTRSIYDQSTQAWIAAYGPFGLRPEDRRYMIELRDVGGSLSTDKLARRLGEGFDDTKRHLERLERLGLLWRRKGHRTFHVVQPANVPHERALRRLRRHAGSPGSGTRLDRDGLRQVFEAPDERSFESNLAQWQQAGILQPAGRGRWRLGSSFLEYLEQRAVPGEAGGG